MTTRGVGLLLRLDEEQFDQLVSLVTERIVDRVGERNGGDWPEWMPLEIAARYLGQTVAATRKLYERRRVSHYQDGPGCKVYLRRSELDAYMLAARNGESA